MEQLLLGDCLEKLKELPENSVDSIVTDPPYELCFMGKSWDSTGIANNVELWKECLRVLKPGGHLLSFSGTRTYHRMAVAIEDAGFEVRDMIEWVYGSGFPKSLNIGKAVDKLQGNEREEFERTDGAGNKQDYLTSDRTKSEAGVFGGDKKIFKDSKGTSEWEGWGTALKPAHEPICMARKPLAEKTVAENCLKYGTGGINIDESRVDFTDAKDKEGWKFGAAGKENKSVDSWKNTSKVIIQNDVSGRFPANLIHDNSEEVRECFPETKSGGGNKATKTAETFLGTGFGGTDNSVWECDSGNASRFFKSIIYQAKASKSERNRGCEDIGGNKHCTVKPISLMSYLIKMVTPKGGTVLDPFTGSGSTGVAAIQNGYTFIGIEMEAEYMEIAKARIERAKKEQGTTLFL